MFLALHNAFASGRIKGNALDTLLPRFVDAMQEDLCRFVDGGAGIGHTALAYQRILNDRLRPELRERARIHCYEPLEENFLEMSGRLGDGAEFVRRQCAVTNENGRMTFVVPSRLQGDSEQWGNGTSYNGFVLPEGGTSGQYETIDVATVRLEDDLDGPVDFVKLDLQGGELEAAKGLGALLGQAKLLYTECQLMSNEGSSEFLADEGYIVLLDQFQFGLQPAARTAPVAELKELGIAINRIHLPSAAGIPLIFWGYLEDGRELFDGYRFSAEVREQLRALGIDYFQSDALCINSRYANRMLPAMHSLI